MESLHNHTLKLRQAVEFEESSRLHEALQEYLKAIQIITQLLLNSQDLRRNQRLELRYTLEVSISRAKFLAGTITLDADAEQGLDIRSSITQLDIVSICDGSSASVANQTLKRCISQISLISGFKIDQEIRHVTVPLIKVETPKMFEKFQTYRVHKTRSGGENNHGHNSNTLRSEVSCSVSAAEVQSSSVNANSSNIAIKQKLLQTVLIESPNVSMQSIIGLEKAKQPIREAILVPILYPDTIQARNSWKGILLFGPSGVGKTQLIKAVATEAKQMTFINIRVDSILSKWMGESEKTVRILFEIARERSPAIIFIDEIDALCGARGCEDSESSRRLKNALLTEMDGIGSNMPSCKVLVVGNTNQPQLLDNAFLRRFNKRIYVPLPSFRERRELLEHSLKEYRNNISDNDLESISAQTHRFSGADIVTLVSTAGMIPLQERLRNKRLDYSTNFSSVCDMRNITMEDFHVALRNTCATNDDGLIRKLEAWNEKYGDSPCPVEIVTENEDSKCLNCYSCFVAFFG